MTFHLPGKLFSVIVSNAETPFSSCWLKPGLTPLDAEGFELVADRFHAGSCPVEVGAREGTTGTSLGYRSIIIQSSLA